MNKIRKKFHFWDITLKTFTEFYAYLFTDSYYRAYVLDIWNTNKKIIFS